MDADEHRQDTRLHAKCKEADSIKFEAMPDMARFKIWKLNFKRAVASASGNSEKTFEWISHVEECKHWSELQYSGK